MVVDETLAAQAFVRSTVVEIGTLLMATASALCNEHAAATHPSDWFPDRRSVERNTGAGAALSADAAIPV